MDNSAIGMLFSIYPRTVRRIRVNLELYNDACPPKIARIGHLRLLSGKNLAMVLRLSKCGFLLIPSYLYERPDALMRQLLSCGTCCEVAS